MSFQLVSPGVAGEGHEPTMHPAPSVGGEKEHDPYSCPLHSMHAPASPPQVPGGLRMLREDASYSHACSGEGGDAQGVICRGTPV